MGGSCSCQKEVEEEKETQVNLNGLQGSNTPLNGNSNNEKVIYEELVKSQRKTPYQNGSQKFESNIPDQKRIQIAESQVSLIKDKVTSIRENSQFEGEMIDNLPDGKGKEIYKNGDEYVGHFSKGKKNGFGVFYKKGEYRYTGNFKNNKMNGYGCIEYDDGSVYKGEFDNGVYHGEGEYIDKNKNKKTGKWNAGNFIA